MAGGSGVADGGWARRYPALAWLAGAVALAMLLPSGLNVPNSGPSSLAEYAPVPGQGQGESPVAELGQASSGDLGDGDGGAGTAATTTSRSDGPGARVVRKPGTKRCVGRPPRQTEDPMSPPCVAFFDGDNGGATTRGVTGEEVRIVIHLGPGTQAVYVDYDQPGSQGMSAQGAAVGDVIRALGAHFRDRYQTYGRRLHFYGYMGPGADNVPEQVRAQVQAIDERWQPFAIVPLGAFSTQILAREASSRGIVTVAYGGYDRDDQRRMAPHLLTFAPDLQDQARAAASFLCAQLTGRPAVHSGNVTDRDRNRDFGFLWQDNPQVPEYRRLLVLTEAEARQQCGLVPSAEASARTSTDTQGDYATNIALMRSREVTTLVFFGNSVGAASWARAADAAKWYPEMVIPGSHDGPPVDANATVRSNPPLAWANVFGITYDVRREQTAEQHWHRAAREGCPDCTFTGDIRNGRAYSQLLVLMWGVQAAGPRLHAANIDKGLHALPARSSPDPFTPAAYFGPGNWSWIKDAAVVWWDPTGPEPGTGTPGCYRLVGNGTRHRPGEFPAGDAAIKRGAPVCQGPDR